MPAPTVTSVTPPTGIEAGGTVVLIGGTNLSGATGVTFNGVAATAVASVFNTVLSAFMVYCIAPANSAGAVDVVVTTSGGSGTGLGAFTYTAENTSYSLFLWDDCCHIWISENTGGTFIQGATPGGATTPAPNASGFNPHGNISTLANAWTDGQMPINDADYSTFLGVDQDYNSSGSGPYGILALSPTGGRNLSYTLIDPAPSAPAFAGNAPTQSYIRAAISGNATTILLATTDNFTGTAYPRISHNAGGTWGNVTGVTGNLFWVGACCGSTVSQAMYLQPDASFPWGSTDWGSTWTELTNGPNGVLAPHAREAEFRMRCSANGQTVITVNQNGALWISTNAGSTWTSIDFPSTFSFTPSVRHADCGITPDGTTIIVGFEQQLAGNRWPAVFVSTNGGSSFSQVTANLKYPASVGPPSGGAPGTHATGFTQCNVAPDGLGMVVTFNYADDGIVEPDGLQGAVMYANVSTDAGATFTLCSFDADHYETGSVLGLFTGIYMTPPSPPSVSAIHSFTQIVG